MGTAVGTRRRFGVARLAASFAVLAILVVPAAGARTNSGTEYWLAFPPNLPGSDLSLLVTGDSATNGTVEIPGLEFSSDFTVTPGQVTSVPLPADAMLEANDAVTNDGVHVTTGAPVSVYGLNHFPGSTDGFLALPVDALGTDYIALAYGDSTLAAVATEDGTTLTVTPSSDAADRSAGAPYQVVLDRGQTYELEASDISGTLVSADKPVAVYGGAECVNIPPGATFACDHIVEQLTATTEWGKEFMTTPLATRRNGDTFRILAAEDDTTVRVNGQAAAELNRGEFHEQEIDRPSVIVADKPVLVMQYANSASYDGTTGDPFQMLVAPTEQYLAAYTIATPPSGFANYLNVVAPEADVGTLELDGVAVSRALFTPIGDSGFDGAEIPVSAGAHRLTAAEPFGVSVYGWAPFESYGYPGGLGLGQVARVATVTAMSKSGKADVGTQQCVDASATDGNGAPVDDVRVDFAVTGANSANGFSFTDAAGESEFCYSGSQPGVDTVIASVGTSSDTATRTWAPMPASTTTGTAATTTTTAVLPAGPAARSDVSVAVAAPLYGRVGTALTFTSTVENAGPDAATGVELHIEFTAAASVGSAALSNGNACLRTTTGVTCLVGTLGAGASVTATVVATPSQAGSLMLAASAQADFDGNAANNSASDSVPIVAADAPPPPPPPPTQPGTFNAITEETVTVNGLAEPAGVVFTIKSGDSIDVTNGSLTLTDFDGGYGTFSDVQQPPRAAVRLGASPVAATFQLRQAAKAGAGVSLVLAGGDFSICSTPRRLTAKNQTPVRELWGQAKGLFTTKGRYSAATIRGTTWLTQDRCDGTLTRAVDDIVDVTDFVKKTTVDLQPGQSYLAQPAAKQAFKPPKAKPHRQTPASVRKHGSSGRMSSSRVRRSSLRGSSRVA